jgi:hypothetical protein
MTINEWMGQLGNAENNITWKSEADKEALRQTQEGQGILKYFQFGSDKEGGGPSDKLIFPPTPPTTREGALKRTRKKAATKSKEATYKPPAREGEEDKAKRVLKTSISFANDSHSHTKIIEFQVPLDYKKGRKTVRLFEDTLDKTVTFFRKYAGRGNSNFTIPPKDEKYTNMKPAKDKSSFPDHQITWMNYYGEFNNNYAFAPLNSFTQRRTVKGSMRVGANMDTEEWMEMAGTHHCIDSKVSFRVKGIQLIKTTSTHMLMGMSIKMGLDTVKSVTGKVPKQIEGATNKPWIKYCIYVGWPGGMPSIERKQGQHMDDNGCQTFIYQVDTQEPHIFAHLLQEAKDAHAWNEVWGSRPFTMETISN